MAIHLICLGQLTPGRAYPQLLPQGCCMAQCLWCSWYGKTVQPLTGTNLHGYQVCQDVKVTAINPAHMPPFGTKPLLVCRAHFCTALFLQLQNIMYAWHLATLTLKYCRQGKLPPLNNVLNAKEHEQSYSRKFSLL